MRQQRTGKRISCIPLAAALVAISGPASTSAQVRAGRRGAVVSGEEGYAAVGRRGNVVTGEEVDVQGAAVGRRGAVVVGEEGAVARGLRTWSLPTATRAGRPSPLSVPGIAIGTILAKPPAAATPVVVTQTTYYYHDGVFFTKVMSSGSVVYQVIAPPAGAIIATLPASCSSARVGSARRTPDVARRITRGSRPDIRSSC